MKCLPLMLMLLPCALAAEPLGRLFLSPAERQAVEQYFAAQAREKQQQGELRRGKHLLQEWHVEERKVVDPPTTARTGLPAARPTPAGKRP